MISLLKRARHNEELLENSEERLFEIRDAIMRIYAEYKIGNGIRESSFEKLKKSARMNRMVFDRLDEISKSEEGKVSLKKIIFED